MIFFKNKLCLKDKWKLFIQLFGHFAVIQRKTKAQVQGFRYVTSKAVPLQAWSGPEGSRKLKFPDFMTTAQDGGKVVSLTHRPPLPRGNTPGTHFC